MTDTSTGAKLALDPEQRRRQTIAIRDELGRMTGESWELDASQDLERLHGKDGKNLALRYATTAHRSRLTFTGLFPDAARGQLRPSKMAITVASTRSPVSIVQEICRRLLPPYVAELERARREVLWMQQELASRRTLAYDLAGLCGGEVQYVDGGYQVLFLRGAERGCFKVETSMHAVLNIDSSNPDVLCELAAFMGRAG